MEASTEDLRRPLFSPTSGSNDDRNGRPTDEEEALLLEEWNASVSAFVENDGGDENSNCYCPSIDEALEEEENDSSSNRQSNTNSHSINYGPTSRRDGAADEERYDSDSQRSLLSAGPTLSRMLRCTFLPDCEPTLGSYSVPIERGTGGNGNANGERDDNDENDNDNDENENGTATHYAQTPRRLVDGPGVVRFAKLALLTFGSIALVRSVVVARDVSDRDIDLSIRQIFLYEGDSILRDLVVWFVVGRMRERGGVDALEWLIPAVVANAYFECQAFATWMQHSVTLYEMHCEWPWQLWVFAVVVAALVASLAVAHASVALERGEGWIRLGEWLACLLVFVAPVAASPYFHFHHWFAGWLLGMHANRHEKWWSRATMAYCWGMYVNGIAVYGRDPLLTCDYARFLLEDQNCPWTVIRAADSEDADAFANANTDARGGLSLVFGALVRNALGYYDDSGDFQPSDWRNCSSSGYHP